jgi:hypothetical protein
MFPLLLAAIVFAFLVVGAIVFLICALIPATRAFALSAALWCAAWGPCAVASVMLAGLALVADALARNYGAQAHLQAINPVKVLGPAYLTLTIIVSAVAATCLAWLHQAIVRRLTFALFRVYATAVVSGIGSVFGLCIGGWIMTMGEPWQIGWTLWIVTTLGLTTFFGVTAYKAARQLRGQPPTTFTWITPEEFAGTST